MCLKGLTTSEFQQFQDDGYCIVPGLLDASEIAAVAEHYWVAAQTPDVEAQVAGDDTVWDNDSQARQVLRKAPKPFDNAPRFREIFSSTKVLDRVEDVIGPRIYLHSSKLVFKPANAGRRKPMHQDLAYWDGMSARQVTLWCAIDRATPENGGLELLVGSHKRGLVRHEDLDDFQVREDELDLSDVRRPVMEAGDMLFLDVLTLHASSQNVSDVDRLAAVVNYYSEPKTAGQHSKYGSTTALRQPTDLGRP